MPVKEYRFRIREAFFEGICVVQISGRLTLGAGSPAFHKYFKQKLADGVRFFVMDFDGFEFIDSAGAGELVSALSTINMRSGKLVLVRPGKLMKFLQITKLASIFELADDFPGAFLVFGVKTTESQFDLDYEDKFSITNEEIDGKPVWVESDNILDQPLRTEYPIQQIPPEGSKDFSPKLLAYSVLTFVVALSLIIFGLVWAVKAVTSIALLTLVFSVALLFLLILVAFVLLLSGHLSEKTAATLFGGVLGKVPGLGQWVSTAPTKKKT